MKHMAVSVILALGIGSFATVASGPKEEKPSDADIAILLVGKWRFESTPQDPAVKITITFAKDQSYLTEAESKDLDGRRHEAKRSGTWEVDKGCLAASIMKSSNPKEEGTVHRQKFVSIDASTFKVRATLTRDPAIPGDELEAVLEFKRMKGE